MASLQVDKANPVEDVITATTKDPQEVAPPPAAAAPVKAVEVEDEEDLPDLDEAPYAEKVDKYSDNEEDNDIEYSPFLDREEDNTPTFSYAQDSELAFAHFNQDHDHDDFAEDDD